MHTVKRLTQHIAINLFRLFSGSIGQLSDYERDAINICRRLLKKPETLLLVSPISHKRYIKEEKDQIFIIISDRTIDIVNHQYSYNINISEKSFNKLKRLFDTEVEQRRSAMEAEIRSNVKHSLHTVYKSLIKEDLNDE